MMGGIGASPSYNVPNGNDEIGCYERGSSVPSTPTGVFGVFTLFRIGFDIARSSLSSNAF